MQDLCNLVKLGQRATKNKAAKVTLQTKFFFLRGEFSRVLDPACHDDDASQKTPKSRDSMVLEWFLLLFLLMLIFMFPLPLMFFKLLLVLFFPF